MKYISDNFTVSMVSKEQILFIRMKEISKRNMPRKKFESLIRNEVSAQAVSNILGWDVPVNPNADAIKICEKDVIYMIETENSEVKYYEITVKAKGCDPKCPVVDCQFCSMNHWMSLM